jgi:hypothetical protein
MNIVSGDWWKSFRGVKTRSTNFKRDIPIYPEPYLQGRMNLDDPGFKNNLAARQSMMVTRRYTAAR